MMLYNYLQDKIVDILIRLVERRLYNTPIRKTMDEDRARTFYANLWEMPYFKEYCVERETRFVHAQANAWTELQKGQRIENMLLFSKAQSAWEKAHKKPLNENPTQ